MDYLSFPIVNFLSLDADVPLAVFINSNSFVNARMTNDALDFISTKY